MDHLKNLLPSQARRLHYILTGEDSDAKLLLVALLDDIARGASTLRDLGFLDGSEAEDERIAEKLKTIVLLATLLTSYHGKPYDLEDQINDFHMFADARRVAADLRVHDLTRGASPMVLLALTANDMGRADGEFPGHYSLPFDVVAGIGLRAYEWYRQIIEMLGTRSAGRTRGIGTDDIRSYIRTTLADSYNQLESDALEVEFYVAMSFLRAKLGVRPPMVEA